MIDLFKKEPGIMDRKNILLIILGGLVSFLLTLMLLYLFSPRRKARLVKRETERPSPDARDEQIVIETTRVGDTDDLTAIIGIGPKISGALQTAGVNTFTQLAGMTKDAIQGILDRAEVQAVASQDWIEQAKAAAKS